VRIVESSGNLVLSLGSAPAHPSATAAAADDHHYHHHHGGGLTECRIHPPAVRRAVWGRPVGLPVCLVVVVAEKAKLCQVKYFHDNVCAR